jgi:hypothetical protein
MASSDNLATITGHTQRLLGLLIAQFLLGMGVNLIGQPGSTLAKVTEGVFLVLHVLIAIGLVTLAVLTVREAFKLGQQWPAFARIGAAGVGVAFIGGVGTMASTGAISNWFSYLMSVGFILAFAGFGYLYTQLRVAQAH